MKKTIALNAEEIKNLRDVRIKICLLPPLLLIFKELESSHAAVRQLTKSLNMQQQNFENEQKASLEVSTYALISASVVKLAIRHAYARSRPYSQNAQEHQRDMMEASQKLNQSEATVQKLSREVISYESQRQPFY